MCYVTGPDADGLRPVLIAWNRVGRVIDSTFNYARFYR